jgi:fructosamine-3-kinase
VADLLDVQVVGVARVHGGDVAQSFRVDLADGATVFAKTHTDPPPGFFTTEAGDLAWLGAPEAVAVPEVLAATNGPGPTTGTGGGVPAVLVLAWIDEVHEGAPDEAAFGHQLAGLHTAGAPTFGRVDRRPTTSRRLPNEPCDSWAEFYASCRLLPLVRLARDAGAVDPGVLDDVERLAGRLDQFGGTDEPPARLHGDLWAGNRIVDGDARSWLIDPAAHGGHREFDLAMMALFGGFGPAVIAAYQDVAPLAAGWEQRMPVHQLAPLLTHAIKFAGPYPAAVAAAVAAANRAT